MPTPREREQDQRIQKLSRERSALTERVRTLERQLADLKDAAADLPPQYTGPLAELRHIALHGVRRPADLGGPIQAGPTTSRPPAHNPAAYRGWEAEKQRLRRHGEKHLEPMVERLAEGHQEEGAA
jgi:hypothetical protein